ncbi:MAG: phosphotransferase enzyme family protein [Dehalococcoidia bacterium]
MDRAADDAIETDDAGGGRRGLRATPSDALLAAVHRAYGIGDGLDPVDLGGSSNLNLLVGVGDGRSVVRVYRPHLTVDRLHAMQAVRDTLARAGVPCAPLLPTRDGHAWLAFENRLVEVERFVAWDAVMDTWERLETGLFLLGRLHTVLRDLAVGTAGQVPQFANYLDATAVVEQTRAGVQRIRAWQPSPSEVVLADDAEALGRAVARAERPFIPQLPRQLVHGDFWDNNVLFRGSEVACITDFDFMGVRPRTDDLALTLYFACMQFFENPVSDAQLGRLGRLLDAYDAGSAIPLSATERAALPLALARQPLWSIGGWVAALDDETAARRHAAGTAASVRWSRRLLDELGRWQTALSGRS